jgi:hypothetical protein
MRVLVGLIAMLVALRGLIAIVAGVREGLIDAHILIRWTGKAVEGKQARAYGWYSIAGGGILLAVGLWLLAMILRGCFSNAPDAGC